MGGRAFELLRLLVQRRGELVSKNELMAAAWPGTFVHDSNLKVNMWSLRRSLGDTQIEPIYIATVARRGYKFIADVRVGIGEIEGEPALADPLPLSHAPSPRGIVGREADIVEIADLLAEDRHVTLTGAGGIGKTTVALAVAQAFVSRYRDGVCFIDLATISDPTLFGAALVTALGIRGNTDMGLAAVLDYLRPRQMLLILDNCEHVLPAATIFASKFMTDTSPSRLLATSREPLGTTTELVVRLGSLSAPSSGLGLSVDQAVRFPAVELFVRRAAEWSDYEFVDEDCDAIAVVCHSLDGLPLAIELAAAQISRFTPRELLVVLDQRLGFSAAGAAAGPPRHETLMATIDWSYRLLSQTEARLFALLSVFSDGFEHEDAVFVAEAAGLTPIDVATALGSLVAKSLLSAQARGASLRYRLLDSTRRYAAERRRGDPACSGAMRRHAERMAALFEQSEEDWRWREPTDWTERYLGRIADLRSALSWSFGEQGDDILGIRLAVAAITLWSETSILSEAQARLEVALALAKRVPCDDLSKAKLACALGWSLFYARKSSNENEVTWLDAIAFARRTDSVDLQQRALAGFAFYLLQIGEIARAITYLEGATSLADRDPDSTATSEADKALAWAHAFAGELSKSRPVLDRLASTHSLARGRSRKDANEVYRFITVRTNMPFVVWMQGQADYAARLAREAVDAADRGGHWVSQSNALGLAALPISLEIGDLDALDMFTERLRRNLERERIWRWVSVERYFSACLRDLRGDPRAVDDLRAAIDELIECRFLMRIGSYLSFLARAYLRQGRIAQARDAVTRAIDYQERQGERWCRSELQRVNASILLEDGETVRAEKLLKEALAEARAIGALTFALRIATDLAAHWAATNREIDAVQLLAPILGEFTEGFGTQDLVRASRLLAQINT
ncbi:putative ATPase [Bradyrhizobium japonicum]|uniref:ATPase n=2 Tax=Bradyrhizobium japonicum TaxID=375 RepID=A0ABV2S0X7_BRAJP|nr:winged helix-turn-helix domain-containing protein [Bradyrhizobium japonicum]MCP1801794.1 putative ATPase [Bradyrhizobium japonicum]MCP1881626.1 putative ATPase [Bradyrhizobium japonicum]MCS4026633.1 putative ATPase [Bradyrhizobium japonicum]MCS4128128.1 putative ATPase [Bradyrhizobium japonicum]WLB22916.1 winged helix-turn-helix domain-containing protein [Bradyrhizobium japonicum]